jgi:hypothetical protein
MAEGWCQMRRLIEEKPWIGWTIAAVMLLGGLYMVGRLFLGGGGADSLTEHVVIVYEDTGEESKVLRGTLQRILLSEAVNAPLNPAQGLTNPKTGKKTGFPQDRAMWEGLVRDVNEAVKKK